MSIATGMFRTPISVQKASDCGGGFAQVDREQSRTIVFSRVRGDELLQRRQLTDTGRAPGRPKIEK